MAALFIAALFTLAFLPYRADAATSDVPEAARQGDIVFAMERKGKTIGAHSVRFTALDDGRLQVDVNIAIKVKFAFITAYRYEHHNQEIWSADGKTLLSVRSQTYDNGKTYSVRGDHTDDGFVVIDQNGDTADADNPVMPTSYWNAGLLAPGVAVLNTQKGSFDDIVFQRRAPGEAAMPNGARQAADVFEATGKLNNVFVNYARGGQCWVGLDFYPPKQKVKISYRLKTYFAQPRADLARYQSLAPCLDLSLDVMATPARDGSVS
ncbi:MAG: DUF6134 family protein [Pseudomonadota bacterium]